MDDLYRQAIKETSDIIYDCLKRTDKINQRLIAANIAITISFTVTMIYLIAYFG